MTKQAMIEKYRDVITRMGDKDDMGVSLDKLIYTAQNLDNPDRDVYEEIPTDLPKEFWDELLEDISKLPKK